MADSDARHDTPRMGGVGYLEAQVQVLMGRVTAIEIQQASGRAAVLGDGTGAPGRLGVVEAAVVSLGARQTTLEGRALDLEKWRIGFNARLTLLLAIGTPIGGVITTLILKAMA